MFSKLNVIPVPTCCRGRLDQLRTHGIAIRPGRNTALAELAADLPTPVVADLVGISISSAIRWARHAQRDWAPYLAARAAVRNTAPTNA